MQETLRLYKKAALPKLGFVNRKQIPDLTGLAPFANETGFSSKRRTTFSGRPIVKHLLFMCALSTTVNHPSLKAFYL